MSYDDHSLHLRRIQDSEDRAQIRRLIEKAEDPKDIAMLMVLSDISDTLAKQSSIIVEVSDKLDKHLTRFEEHTREEERIINQSRGGMRVVLWVLSAIQVLAMAFASQVYGQLQSLADFMHHDIAAHAVIDTRLQSLEGRISKHEDEKK